MSFFKPNFHDNLLFLLQKNRR